MTEILVIGSSNTDMVIKTSKLPTPGETILGGTFLLNQGGKGANQAVAAKRLGGMVTFIMKHGNDLFGSQAVDLLAREQIDTQFVIADPELPSGVALINVDSKGENSIVVAPGSNNNLLPEDIPSFLFDSSRFGILLLQLEIPLETVRYCGKKAFPAGIRVILNPAPAQILPDDLLENLWLITPNETEALSLTGIHINDPESADKASSFLINKGVKNVIITLGKLGAFIKSDDFSGIIPGVEVKAIDTTAAGDVFNGAVAVALSNGKNLKDAVIFANRAAAISVTRMGAQPSAPYKNEL